LSSSLAITGSCRVCGSDRIAPKHAFAATKLHRCRECGFWFCHPVVNTEAASSGPSSIITDEGYSDRLLRPTAAQEARYGVLARRRCESYRKLLGRSAFSMLEVGCGSGDLGAEFIRLGVDYHGVNIDVRVVQAGQRRLGDRIQQRDFLSMEADRQYDLVCFHQVLEHITEPRLFARRVRECTNPRGGIHGDVPNVTGLSASVHRLVRLDQRRFGAIILPHHQFAYEPKTIQSLLGGAFRLRTFDVKGSDPTWGQASELGCAEWAYSAVSGFLHAGGLMAFFGTRLTVQ
jgi:SAM-dependent methyltransferase